MFQNVNLSSNEIDLMEKFIKLGVLHPTTTKDERYNVNKLLKKVGRRLELPKALENIKETLVESDGE